jgi:hypothetical protein
VGAASAAKPVSKAAAATFKRRISLVRRSVHLLAASNSGVRIILGIFLLVSTGEPFRACGRQLLQSSSTCEHAKFY